MAKKLKYPYEQWKEQQNKPSSRSPSPMEAAEDEGFSSSSSSPQTVIPNVMSMSDYQETFTASRHIYGKWCLMLHVLHMGWDDGIDAWKKWTAHRHGPPALFTALVMSPTVANNPTQLVSYNGTVCRAIWAVYFYLMSMDWGGGFTGKHSHKGTLWEQITQDILNKLKLQ